MRLLYVYYNLVAKVILDSIRTFCVYSFMLSYIFFKNVILKIFSEEVFNVIEIVFIVHLSIFNVAPFYSIEFFTGDRICMVIRQLSALLILF